jgi:hypothetical protein
MYNLREGLSIEVFVTHFKVCDYPGIFVAGLLKKTKKDYVRIPVLETKFQTQDLSNTNHVYCQYYVWFRHFIDRECVLQQITAADPVGHLQGRRSEAAHLQG